MDNKNSPIRFIYIGETINPNPSYSNPVNSLGVPVRLSLQKSIQNAISDPNIKGIILIGKGPKTFSAGADIREFNSKANVESSPDIPSLMDLCHLIASCPKPTVAAIRGVALGGGLELALSCHFRICTSDAKLGLPEVNIGLIPGAGGTQRLPRLSSLRFALDAIVSGKMINATDAFENGVVDTVSSGRESLEDCALRWANWACLVSRGENGLMARHASNCAVAGTLEENTELVQAYGKKQAPTEKGGEAKQAAIRAITASFTEPTFEKGCAVEEELFWDLLLESKQGRARRHAFFSERTAQVDAIPIKRIKNLKETMRTVGVIGAGTMGSGIALSFLLAGYNVILIDVNAKGLQRGVKFLTNTVSIHYVTKKRLSPQKAERMLKNLSSGTTLDLLAPCDVVLEAVFENLNLKQSIFSKLDGIVTSPTALLLTNTSTLDINSIMSGIPTQSRLRYCCGMHFFSPAHVMKLVEIIQAQHTSPETIGVVRQITKSISKIGVVVQNGDGFVGNRMLLPYGRESAFCLLNDPIKAKSVLDVDLALTRFGMAIGPFVMNDLAGGDIGYLIRKEQGLVRDEKTGVVGKGRIEGMRYSELSDDLVMNLKRIGQKVGKGWYNYDPKKGKGRLPLPSAEVSKFISQYQTPSNTTTTLTHEELVERILYPLVNEGFKILEEGIARKPSDIDVIYIYGYGWPVWRGGPMYWADHEVGLEQLLSKLEEFYKRYPGSEYFKPSKLLQKCVSLGMTVEEYYKQKRNGADAALSSKL